MNKESTRIICYELNEIPESIIRFYIKKYPHSNFSKLLNSSSFFKTNVSEKRHLHPWSVWPTVHRGVASSIHKINFINQDKKSANIFPPIWEYLAKKNITVGVHGSLQSYPPFLNKNIKFFLPDTFAPEPSAHPLYLKEIQEINLHLIDVSRGRIKASISKIITLFFNLTKKGVFNFKTIISLCFHLFSEKLNYLYKSRRSIYQAAITFDSFYYSLCNEKPRFATYFTNHLAGMMHRYWKYLFPKEFKNQNSENSFFYKNSIIKALHHSDDHIGKLLKYCKDNNAELLVISGMGQAAKDRGIYKGELKLKNFKKLIEFIYPELNEEVEILPAMQPDLTFKFKSPETLKIFLQKISKITDTSKEKIFLQPYSSEGITLNLSLNTTNQLLKNKTIFYENDKFDLNFFGLKIEILEQGSAYHINSGCLIWNTRRNHNLKALSESKYEVDIREIAPSILKFFKKEIPNHMIQNSKLIDIWS